MIILELKLLDAFEKVSEKENFEFIVVHIPDKREVSEEYQQKFLDQWSDVDESFFEFRKIENIFSEKLPAAHPDSEYPIEYISLFDLAEANFDNFYFKTDPHWNSQGVSLSADYIAEELKKKNII
ncbi:hypothetical protein CMI37_26485 [Candidatus Pacearchaeota archaeon]|nr:hypothetical protein [Candidatus Pacearchaeota archaeon]|tara:strand:+ start:2447 stop:2821 length:375 start_codon:yes stop_codon:yes gene_type:complete